MRRRRVLSRLAGAIGGRNRPVGESVVPIVGRGGEGYGVSVEWPCVDCAWFSWAVGRDRRRDRRRIRPRRPGRRPLHHPSPEPSGVPDHQPIQRSPTHPSPSRGAPTTPSPNPRRRKNRAQQNLAQQNRARQNRFQSSQAGPRSAPQQPGWGKRETSRQETSLRRRGRRKALLQSRGIRP